MKKPPKKFTTSNTVFQKPAQPQKSPSIPRSFTEDNERGSLASLRSGPRAARKIPERVVSLGWVKLATVSAHWEVIFVSFVCGLLLMGIVVMSSRLLASLEELKKREAMQEHLLVEKHYWEEIVSRYPDYKDAYYQLAVFSYKLGLRGDAAKAVGHVLVIDPNDKAGQELAKKIRG